MSTSTDPLSGIPSSQPSYVNPKIIADAPLGKISEDSPNPVPQEVAYKQFTQINKDYERARIIYTETAMRGRGSKKVNGMPCILWDLKAFMKWVKAEAERVAFEVKISRQNEYHRDYWSAIKDAFKAELDRIRQTHK